MEEDPVSNQLFTCSICGKQCGTKKSQLRHISYCRRSKSRGLDRSRKKSCQVCTKAKTHCDLAYPSCSRCSSKRLNCEYGQPRPITFTVAQSYASSDEVLDLDSGLTTTLDAISQQADIPIETGLSQASVVRSTASPYENVYSDGEWDFALTTSHSRPPTGDQSLKSDTQFSYLETTSTHQVTGLEIMKALMFPELTTKAIRSFWPRKIRDNQSSLNKAYVLNTLRSYPSMLLPGKGQPPFIHPQSMTKRSLLGPLATCAAILQMFSVRNENNTIFIWKAIRMEQERLSTECDEYNDETLVAALQALTIYILLRLFEKNEEATNFDIPLIYTLIKIGIKTKGFCMTYGNPFPGSVPTWKDWMLSESLRRTIIVVLLIDLLYDISSSLPTYKCDGSVLPQTTLPCSRDLWRASSEEEWRSEYIARGSAMQAENEPTHGDLLRFRLRTEGRDSGDKKIEDWLAHLDDLGMLVMAAASLPVFH